MKVDLVGCARCHGEGHARLEFSKFTFPAVSADGATTYTHWAICPMVGEPILMQMVAARA